MSVSSLADGVRAFLLALQDSKGGHGRQEIAQGKEQDPLGMEGAHAVDTERCCTHQLCKSEMNVFHSSF